jgi:hypothetical protein
LGVPQTPVRGCLFCVHLTPLKNSQKNLPLANFEYEREVERQISQYIQTNISFTLLEALTKEERLLLKSRLIGTVSRCESCFPSESWFGRFSPIEKIRQNGLWQVKELYSQPLNIHELEQLKGRLIR